MQEQRRKDRECSSVAKKIGRVHTVIRERLRFWLFRARTRDDDDVCSVIIILLIFVDEHVIIRKLFRREMQVSQTLFQVCAGEVMIGRHGCVLEFGALSTSTEKESRSYVVHEGKCLHALRQGKSALQASRAEKAKISKDQTVEERMEKKTASNEPSQVVQH
jgi:hypothetical protein